MEFLISLLTLLYKFFIISALTFGGGLAMIPLITELIIKPGMITNNDFLDFMSISELLPGPFATDVATFIGFESAGLLGVLFAMIGITIPSIILISIILTKGKRFLESKIFKHIVKFLKMGVVGFIGAIGLDILITILFPNLNLTLFKTIDFGNFNYMALIVFVIIFGLSKFKKLNNPFILLGICAVLGIIFL